MRQSRTLDSGLEVHQDSMAVADSAQEHHAEGVALGNLGTRPGDLDHLLRTLQSNSHPRILVDEAGPGGSWLDRSLTQTGQGCGVVAPALIPHKPGDRVQTHRRAASTRARRRRSGDLPPVDVPTVDDAARRDLGRGRADAIRALTTAPCRLNALRLRPASRDPGRATWGPAPLRWRSAVVCPPPAPPLVCQDDRRAVTEHPARRTPLDQARRDQGQTWRRAPVVDALQARRGVPCPVAVTTGAERGDRTRCDHPRPLMHSRGVTPAADATGARRRPGGLTTTGHSPARRALVAGAGADGDPANVRRHWPRRLEKGAKPLHDIRGKAQRRRGNRDRQLRARGNNAHQVVVAIARAWSACLGAMATQGARTPSRPTMASPAAVAPRG